MKKSLLALILACIVVMSLSAQFTAETRLVIVNLSAKDKSGKPIMTLKKEDVEVFEDNVKQDIKVFELQKLDGESLLDLNPGMRVLYMSGYAGDVVASDRGLDPGFPFIQKPFTAASLTGKIREILDDTLARAQTIN